MHENDRTKEVSLTTGIVARPSAEAGARSATQPSSGSAPISGIWQSGR